jgi:adenine-specific DNA-methyltransferase
MTESHPESTVIQPAPTEQPERLDLLSHEIVSDKQAEIVRLFPEVRTEGGKIDFDRLKRVLGGTVDPGKERYGMNWAGKADCFKAIQSPSLGTLLPCREESIEFDGSENAIIEGDNLEVLKLLQKAYLGKIKMIFIDPPYNTGNDFIYPDNYTESLQTYLEYTGQLDSEGRKFSTNTEADGRFHSKWINMLYPRLYLARNLLREDGIIFITIDDGEQDNLKKICNEIFGEDNFVAQIVWQKKQSPQNDATNFSDMHDYVLAYAKRCRHAKNETSGWVRNLLPRTESQDARYSNPDNDPRGAWTSTDYTCNKTSEERPNLYYPITNPTTGEEVWPSKQRVWGVERSVTEVNLREKRIWWGANGKAMPRVKNFLSEVQGGIVPSTWWTREEAGDNQESSREVIALFPDATDIFDTPKPVRLVKRMLQIATDKAGADIILDFFAGSGTTGHSVIDQNREDGGNRRFILVQLPEPTGRTDFPTIAEITKERIRRVLKKVDEEEEGNLDLQDRSKQGRGFRVFKLSTSCFKVWQSPANAPPLDDTHQAALVKQLELHIDHIVAGRGAEDLLYELLLKSGFPMSTKIETIVLEDKTVYSVSKGEMLICLEKALTTEVIKNIAERKPWRVICLDEGFAGNDQLKTNAVQIMKSKGVTSFRTV